MRMGLRIAALAAASAMIAQPCTAARLDGDGGPERGRVGAFAGAAMVLPFESRRPLVPTARLQLSPAYAFHGSRSGDLPGRSGSGVELGLTAAGRLDFRLAGHSPAEMKQRIGFKGSTGYIVVGGLLVTVLLLAAVASASPKPGPRPGDF